MRTPSLMRAIAPGTATTQGMPYSRAVMAGWERMPPVSVTTAPATAKRGVQGGAVITATSTSPWERREPSARSASRRGGGGARPPLGAPPPRAPPARGPAAARARAAVPPGDELPVPPPLRDGHDVRELGRQRPQPALLRRVGDARFEVCQCLLPTLGAAAGRPLPRPR